MNIFQKEGDERLYLLGRHVERDGSQVYLAVRVDAGHDEEDARTAGAALQQPTEAEDDGPLVFLHHLFVVVASSMLVLLNWERCAKMSRTEVRSPMPTPSRGHHMNSDGSREQLKRRGESGGYN